jgi:hypothetical protein
MHHLLHRELAIVLLCTVCAHAAPVGPGETVPSPRNEWTDDPAADVIAEQTHPFTANYILEAGYSFVGTKESFITGTLRTRVLRESATQRLTFLYDFDHVSGWGDAGMEGGHFRVSSFTGFTTDAMLSQIGRTVARSADGSSITYQFVGEGQLSGLQTYAIATDATEYNADGLADVHFLDEFVTEDAFGNIQTFSLVPAESSFSGLFQPTTTTEPPPNPIPLPPAVWTGLFTLATAGASIKLRHRLFNLR